MRLPTSRAGRWPVVLAAAAGLGAVALGAGHSVASAEAADETAGQAVSYRDYQVEVPADWRVVDLADDPTACLRFDEPTVYLGTPAADQDCPATVQGRTAGLVVEPLAEVPAERITADTTVVAAGEDPAAVADEAASRHGAVEVAVEGAGLLVTAAHTEQTEERVRAVLATAEVTADAEPTAAPEPLAGPAPAVQAGPQPGDYVGEGFDQCTAPSQAAMDAWLADSPYQAVGIYISGGQRGCDQPNLTPEWVEAQTGNGWHLIPIDVGKQAPCSTRYSDLISTDPTTAHEQGVTAANESVAAAQGLGIPEGSVLYSDIEAYDPGGSCTTGVLHYLSGWTEGLHANDYLAGMYSSAASGISDVAAAYHDDTYTRVDHIWFAWWNGQADTDAGQYVPAEYWANSQRIHQYVGETQETHGGVTINIDRNYLDVASGG